MARASPRRASDPGLSLVDVGGRPGSVDVGRSMGGNLPVALTALIGREGPVADLGELLARSRLLTLCGAGGCGKSRLGLAVAHQAVDGFEGGAWWLDFGVVSDPDLVEQLVLSTLQLAYAGGRVGEVVARELGDRAALLVFDNCEHLIDACAGLAVELLAACPGLRVLATSRRPFGMAGEQQWPVAGLDLPTAPGEHEADLSRGAAEAASVQLFVERARAVLPSFALTDANRPSVVRICRWLDGLPLGLELAAARVAVLSVVDIAERLERDGLLLGQSARRAPARQRTLEATLDWSHGLLTPDEQILFRRLAVFSGTFSLEAAEAVCAGDRLRWEQIFELLASLVEQSLVGTVDRAGVTRYQLPSTAAQYAAGRLAASGETPAAREALAHYLLELAGAEGRLTGTEREVWLERLELEHDNLRAALGHLLPSDVEAGGRLTGLLWPFWYRLGLYTEARLWLDKAVAVAAGMSAGTRAGVLAGSGVLAFLQCEYPLAKQRLEAALAGYVELGDRRGSARVLQRLGSIEREQGRYEDARALHDRARGLWQELGDEVGVAASLDYLCFAAWLSGDLGSARELGERALQGLRTAGGAQETAECLVNLGATAHYAGDDRQAVAYLEEGLAISRGLGYLEGVAWSLHELAIAAGTRRDLAAAAAMLRESVLVHAQLRDRWRACSVVEEIAGTLLARRDPERACQLLAAADAQRQALGTPLPPAERPAHTRALKTLQARLGPAAFAQTWERGGMIDLERAVAMAVSAIDQRYAPALAPREAGTPVLSERELAVLGLVCAGRTNREIGAELFISASTAGVHVSNILRKLGTGSRAQAANIAERLGLLNEDCSPAGE